MNISESFGGPEREIRRYMRENSYVLWAIGIRKIEVIVDLATIDQLGSPNRFGIIHDAVWRSML